MAIVVASPARPGLRLDVQIWSDLACPWCYVGKRRLETALRDFAHAEAVTLHYRSFQLDPSSSASEDESRSYVQCLAQRYDSSEQQAQNMIERLRGVAAREGLALDFQAIRAGNTFDAQRLLQLAEQRGRAGALKERLLRAYFCEGAALGDHATLLGLSAEVGLSHGECQAVLASTSFAREVRADQARARMLGIGAAPFFLIGRHGVAGAQPAALLRELLEQAWQEAESEAEPVGKPHLRWQ